MPQIVLIVHNVRSAHNVGSLLRTADGLGVEKLILSGYTPYPKHPTDSRMPHLANKTHKQIQKTALGAEDTVAWEHISEISKALNDLERQGFIIAALEQTATAQPINKFKPPSKLALIVGNEVDGLDELVLSKAQIHLQIPMYGAKESFNVAVATAIALYHIKIA